MNVCTYCKVQARFYGDWNLGCVSVLYSRHRCVLSSWVMVMSHAGHKSAVTWTWAPASMGRGGHLTSPWKCCKVFCALYSKTLTGRVIYALFSQPIWGFAPISPPGIGEARILSGVHFFLTKVDLFLVVVASKRRSKTTNSSSKFS